MREAQPQEPSQQGFNNPPPVPPPPAEPVPVGANPYRKLLLLMSDYGWLLRPAEYPPDVSFLSTSVIIGYPRPILLQEYPKAKT